MKEEILFTYLIAFSAFLIILGLLLEFQPSQPITGQSILTLAVAKCSDGTVYGQCSVTKPKLCDNGKLVDSCNICGCLPGQSCDITTKKCTQLLIQPTKSSYSDSMTSQAISVASPQPVVSDGNTILTSGNISPQEPPQGYIIEFKEDSIIAKSNAVTKQVNDLRAEAKSLRAQAQSIGGSIGAQKLALAQRYEQQALSNETSLPNVLKAQKDKLVNEHSLALADISKRIGQSKVMYDFKILLDGITLNVSEKDLDNIKKSSYVKNTYPNTIAHASLNSSVPEIGAPQVWQMSDSLGQNVTGIGTTVAIVDTGIDYTHPDLGGCFGPSCKVIGGWDFVNGDADPKDDQGHGTHCAGIVAANGALKGVAPGAKLYAYKVLDSGGSGSYSNVINGIERAMDPNQDGNYSDHATVISMSLGGPGTPTDSLSQAVSRAVNAGVVVVVAAGNSGPNMYTVDSPGLAPDAITVGATCKTSDPSSTYCTAGGLASFSSRGSIYNFALKPEISAPGVRIYSTLPKGSCSLCSSSGYGSLSGTSMATPHVAGAVALLKQLHPDWTPAMVKSALVTGSKPLNISMWYAGAGKLYVPNASSAEVFFSEAPVSYGLPTGVQKNITLIKTGSSQTFSINPQDWFSMYVNYTAASQATNRAAVSPSSITLAPQTNGQFSMSVAPSTTTPEGFYEGNVMLSNGSYKVRLPFAFIDLTKVVIHVIDLNGYEVTDPYGGVWVFDKPYASNALARRADGYNVCPPATFMLPSGNYSIYAAGHHLLYMYQDPYILNTNYSVIRSSSTKDIYLNMSGAKTLTLNLSTKDGNPIFVKDYRFYWRHIGPTVNLSLDLDSTDYSLRHADFLTLPKSMTFHVNENTDTLGFSLVGYSYSKDLWRFFSRNWDHWFNALSSTPFKGEVLESTADLKYMLSWEFFGGINSSAPSTLNMNDSLMSNYTTKYDILGAINDPWLNWGGQKEIGGTAAFWTRRDTDSALSPFFAGMTQTTYVQGTFTRIYYPESVLDGFVDTETYLPNLSVLARAATASEIYLPNRNFLTPLPAASVTERFARGSFYPSLYLNVTASTATMYMPLFRDQSNARAAFTSTPTMYTYQNGLMTGITLLAEFAARPFAVRMINLSGTGTYEFAFSLPSSPEINPSASLTLHFTVPQTDMTPPRIVGFGMPQRFVSGDAVKIYINTTDDKSATSLSMSWRPDNGSAWSPITVTSLGSGAFTGTVQTTSATQAIHLAYRVSDVSGNYLDYTASNVALKQVPVFFDLSPNTTEIEYKDTTASILLTGYLTNATGAPLHYQAGVPIELWSGNRKLAMILDDYVTSNATHNGTIRFNWRLNPVELFENETMKVDVNFDLGIYQPVNRSFTLHAVGYVSSQPCSDGTPPWTCSVNQPKRCTNGVLIDNCTVCGCPSGYSCNATTNGCYLSRCSDGTPYGQCSANKPTYCNNYGTSSPNCPLCGCPADYGCNSSSKTCYLLHCSDGTAYGQCSVTKPNYCANGTVIDNCSTCGCSNRETCAQNQTCYLAPGTNLPAYPSVSTLNSTFGTNTDDENIICHSLMTDPEGDSMTISVDFYLNGSLNQGTSTSIPKSNGTLFNSTVLASSTKVGDFWKCRAKLNDSRGWNEWGPFSSEIQIVASAPTQKCSDGTYYGQCSITKPKYCNNGSLIDKCQSCNCPANYTCNTTSQACYIVVTPQTCSDGTLYGQCSAAKPKYCDNGTLTDKCSSCGCPAGQSCNTTSNSCYNPKCSDGTSYGQCSATKPKFCDNGQLVDRCGLCGCVAGYNCNSTSNSCYLPTCSDGTTYGQCSATKPKYCDNGNLVDNCQTCGCPSGYSCNATTKTCYLPTCSDGTLYNQCSVTKPKYCDNGNLIDNCQTCSCPSGYSCNSTTKACYVPICPDGTAYGQCSITKPKYCDNGSLTDKCSSCSCPAGQSCNSTTNSCYVPIIFKNCSDGTTHGSCSVNQPKFCDNGNLSDKCPSCGCPTGYLCNSSSGSCYVAKCSDNTLYNQCSATKPKYCDNGGLVNKCSACGCLEGYSCNTTTESCYVPICPDGTAYGQCSLTKPKYCNNSQLINKCTSCGCLSSNVCNAKTNKCRNQPTLKSSFNTNTTVENLVCSWTASDLEGSNINVTFNWYRNDTLFQTFAFMGVSDTQPLNTTIDASNLSVGDVWKCSTSAIDSNLSTSEANSTFIIIVAPPTQNYPPITPQPTLVSSDGTNLTSSNLDCYATLIDLNGDVLSVDADWYRNNGLALSMHYSGYHTSDSIVSTLLAANLSAGETWLCSMRASDGSLYSDWGNSSALTIIAPPAPPTPQPPGGGAPPSGGAPSGGGGAPPSGGTTVTPPKPACVNSLEVTVPQEIFVPQGVTKEISVVVKNTGTCNLSSVAVALSLPPGWQANSYTLGSGLGVNETGIMSIRLFPLYSPIGNYPVTIKLDAPNMTTSKAATIWLLENPPYVVSQEGSSASKIFEYIIALILIEFVFGSIVMMIWFKPPETGRKLPPLPQVGSDLKPVEPDEWWKKS